MLSSAVDWSDLPKEVIHQSLVAKARITTFCKAIHVRQFAKGLTLMAMSLNGRFHRCQAAIARALAYCSAAR